MRLPIIVNHRLRSGPQEGGCGPLDLLALAARVSALPEPRAHVLGVVAVHLGQVLQGIVYLLAGGKEPFEPKYISQISSCYLSLGCFSTFDEEDKR